MYKYREAFAKSPLSTDDVCDFVYDYIKQNNVRDEFGLRVEIDDLTVAPCGDIEYVYSCKVTLYCDDSTGYNTVREVDDIVYETLITYADLQKELKNYYALTDKQNIYE
jgi:hypothetical protein